MAGDGYAYMPFYYYEGDVGGPAHMKMLRVNSGGASNQFSIFDFQGGVTPLFPANRVSGRSLTVAAL